MSSPDLNLLVTMHALLSEGSVVKAARRLRLSSSAMSRALARLRETTGDPLLVRAGRGLVPTPRAIELREPVSRLVEEAEAALRPARLPDVSRLRRTFVVQTSDGFAENFGAAFVQALTSEAPQVRVRFLHKVSGDSAGLRDGSVDLETGIAGSAAHGELKGQALFRDTFVGVVRRGHSLSRGRITPRRFAGEQHVAILRRGEDQGPIDTALRSLGLQRHIVASVSGFGTAVALARSSDLVATVPERHTASLREGLVTFRLPLALPPLTVSMFWHPRMQTDPAHRWMRGCLQNVCNSPRPDRTY